MLNALSYLHKHSICDIISENSLEVRTVHTIRGTYLQTGKCVNVPDPDNASSGQANDVLVFLVAADIDHSEQVAQKLAYTHMTSGILHMSSRKYTVYWYPDNLRAVSDARL